MTIQNGAEVLLEQNYSNVRSMVDIVLGLSDVTIDMAHIERVPRYTEHCRENNAEHSYMLGLVASEIIMEHYPTMNAGLACQFALVHDLPELVTGDTPTFHLSPEQQKQKAMDEKNSMNILKKRLPRHTYDLAERYERQTEPEARLVRLTDKLLPVAVDILGPGTKVMHEDYNVLTHHELKRGESALRNRFSTMFPESSMAPLHAARTCLAELFALTFDAA